jgi:hypothetical protein
MASGKSSYLENAVLKHVFGIASFTAPANLYFAIYKGDPEASGTEVSGGSYARVSVASGSGQWSASANVVTNINDITFPTATADWATTGTPATHIAVFDASSGGNMLYSAPLIVPVAILNGNTFKISAGQAIFTED